MTRPTGATGPTQPDRPTQRAEPTQRPEPTQPAEPDAGSPAEPTGARLGGPADDAWRAWQKDVVDIVRSMPDGGSLTVAAAEADSRPVRVRRARLGGFIPAKHVVVSPWVRLTREEDLLRGACVGAESFGGSFPFSAEEDTALLTLGWHHPSVGDGHDYVHFWPDDVPQGPFLPLDEAQRAADMVAATFRRVLLAEGATGLPVLTRD